MQVGQVIGLLATVAEGVDQYKKKRKEAKEETKNVK